MTRNYEDFLAEQLEDLEEAIKYLSACLEEGPEAFLVGLRDVAKVHGGMVKLSKETELSRMALYKMLSEEGNPTFTSILAVVDAFGFEFDLKRKLEGTEAA